MHVVYTFIYIFQCTIMNAHTSYIHLYNDQTNINRKLFNHVVTNCQFVHDTIEIESRIHYFSLSLSLKHTHNSSDHILLLLVGYFDYFICYVNLNMRRMESYLLWMLCVPFVLCCMGLCTSLNGIIRKICVIL